jgi:hypothetical protein
MKRAFLNQQIHNMASYSLNPHRLSAFSLVVLATLPAASHVCAQTTSATANPGRYEPVVRLSEPASAVLNVQPYAANAKVGKIEVEVAADGLPADGQTPSEVTIKVFDRDGKPLTEPVLVTVEVSGGRIQLPKAGTDELGSRALDNDRTTRGTQVKVENGKTSFSLLAPIEPQDVKMRVTAGEVAAVGTISYVPELRDMIAAGLIEGVVRLSRKDPDQIQPVRINDGFEQELRQWSREFSNDKGRFGARTTLFLKGKIRGDALLTAAYDSDKETRARLLNDIKPEEFYPVYGDASIRGFEAKSSAKLFVRVDKNKSYALFGDFSTGDGFAQPTVGGATATPQLNQLGAYNRTLTGGRWHMEGARGFVNTYLVRDTLKQVVEEYRANGTSGPFAVKNSSALENSEKVELIVRDKNQLNVILSVTPLQRFADYSFEPFSGRILFKGPIPSLDENGNSVSIRVTYEVDQGGERFWLGGIDGQFNVSEMFSIGGAAVEDRNPTSPYKLRSVNVGVKFGPRTSLVAEIAKSSSVAYESTDPLTGLTSAYSNPYGAGTAGRIDKDGKAARIEFNHQGQSTDVRAYVARADEGFDNPNSGLNGGMREAAVQAKQRLTDRLSLFGEAVRSEDKTSGGKRSGGTLGGSFKLTERVELSAGMRKSKENGLLAGQAFIGANPSPGSLFDPTGGFTGGIDPSQVNPLTGLPVTQNSDLLGDTGTGTSGSTNTPSDSTSGFLGLKLHATDRLTVSGLVEADVSGEDKRRYELGAAYQVAERTRLYARAERQTGLASLYSLNQSEKSNAFVLGVDNTYKNDSSGMSQLFTEYRLRDAVEGREAQAATGLRNTFNVREGLALSTGAEYLKILNGDATSAAALTFGLDYTASELWKGSGRVEIRRQLDTKSTAGNDAQTSLLVTGAVARKLARDWTGLVRNYYLRQYNNQDSLGAPLSDGWQDRFQIGFAYRPVDHNKLDVLSKYEYLTENNINSGSIDASGQPTGGERARAHILSTHAVYHLSQPWWLSGRIAAKYRKDNFGAADNNVNSQYSAWLLGGRMVYDITENWDLGVLASTLQGRESGQTGKTRQYAYGVEAGYLLQQNLWLSAGYNWSGFSDKDLVGSDYTNGGAFVRLRFKFDENLFKGSDKVVNRSLDR